MAYSAPQPAGGRRPDGGRAARGWRPAQAPPAPAAAPALARTRLADTLAHSHGDPLGAMVRRCAQALALAVDPGAAPTQRRAGLTAAAGELLALAIGPPPTPATPAHRSLRRR